jgi:peptidoglycan/LPS O-acetylase OafA/YrhL
MPLNPDNSKSFSYRKEIDGLRAIAVIPVILFHAGFESVSGGFVGVDVFFVISGYLITTIILVELQRGEFSLSNFYERRARRILPALFLVMFACLPFAWFLLLPNDLKDFSESLAAVTVFSSNILFWRESGYFAASAELKPLLHTWSLAVEEQFYILFPLLLLFSYRYGKKSILTAVGIIFACSLLLSHWGATTKPAATFYLLPTRAWELLLGAFAAFYLSHHPQKAAPSALNQAGSLIGSIFILYAVLFYDRHTPFPSLYALAPTVGTLLVILFTTKHTFVGRILSTKALVGIGLVSYSAYLWHQPLFAFFRYKTIDTITSIEAGLLITATFSLAYLSWKYLELPFRNKRITSKTVVIYSCVGGLIGFSLIGLTGILTDGKIGRLGNDARYEDLTHRLRGNYGLHELCESEVIDRDECKTALDPEILLWGDSYAMHLAKGLISSNKDVRLIQATVSQCAPVLGLAPSTAIYGARSCIDGNDRAIEVLDRHKSIKYVVLSSPSFLLTVSSIATKDGGVKSLSRDVIEAQLIETIQSIESRGAVPVIFSPPPASGRDIGQCLLKAEMLGTEKNPCNFPLSEAEAHQSVTLETLRRLEKMGHKIIWLADGICDAGICNGSVQETFIYRDGGHLSYEGSAFLGRKMNFYERITENRPQ